jgi:hypothetical protein
LAAFEANGSLRDMPFIVGQSARVSSKAGNADLVFLHGIGEGAMSAQGHNNGLDVVQTRSPFLNAFACDNFRLIAPQLASRAQRWADRLQDLADLLIALRASPEDQARPLFVCGFSIGGAGVVDAVNRFAAGSDIVVSAWCCVDAALPGGAHLPAISARAAQIRHLLVRGPFGFGRADEVELPCAHAPPINHHTSVAMQVFQEGRQLRDSKHLYAWLLAQQA